MMCDLKYPSQYKGCQAYVHSECCDTQHDDTQHNNKNATLSMSILCIMTVLCCSIFYCHAECCYAGAVTFYYFSIACTQKVFRNYSF